MTITILTTVTYPTIKVLEEKEHRIGELKGPYTSNLVLGELGLRGAILWLSLLPEPGLLTQLNWLLSWSSLTELGDSLALALASKKATNLYRDMQRYATTFQMTNASTIKDVEKAL